MALNGMKEEWDGLRKRLQERRAELLTEVREIDSILGAQSAKARTTKRVKASHNDRIVSALENAPNGMRAREIEAYFKASGWAMPADVPNRLSLLAKEKRIRRLSPGLYTA